MTHLAAPSAPVLLWPGNQPLPASLECVGVLGGTEAISAGQIGLLIPPIAWDAVTRSAAGEAFEIEVEYGFFNDPNSPTCDASWHDPGYYAINYSFHASDRRPDSGRWSTLFKVCRVSSDDD